MTTTPALAKKYMDAAVTTMRGPYAAQATAILKDKFGAQLISGLTERAHFFGEVGDFDEALAVAEEIAALHGEKRPKVRLTLARLYATLHRFGEAEAEIDGLIAAGAVTDSEVLLDRAGIWLARGEARRVWDKLSLPNKGKAPLGMVILSALALADLGEVAQAEVQFRRALSAPSDGAPQPIARGLFLWGRMWERQGVRARAKELYEHAYKIFPLYAPLASHLAALENEAGNRARAIELVRPFAAAADPEYKAQLGELTGDAALIAAARADYEALLAKHPLAFADHAARFYLGPGKNPTRALELATINLENRPADEAYQLLLDAAHAAADTGAPICAAAHAAAAFPDASAYLLFAASRALEGCGDAAAAKAALARADKAPRAR